MDLKEILAAVRHGWWLVVIGLVVGAAVAAGVNLLTVPTYTSRAQFFVSTTDSASSSDALQGGQFSRERVASYARLLGADQLLGRVIRELELDRTPEELADDVEAAAVPDTVLLDLRVTDTSPERARDIAAAIGREFAAMVRELETPEGATAAPVRVTVIDVAELPERASEPQPVRNLAVGLLVGLLIGASVAVARSRLDRTLREPDEVAAAAKAPLIGTIVRDDLLAHRHVVDHQAANRPAEDFRRLRTNLQFLNVDEPPRVILVSSPLPAEGKTTVTINLGVALAETGRRVLVMEADLRRPRVTRYLRRTGGVGLTNVLAGTATLDEVTQPYGSAGMFVLGAGPAPPNPGELLASAQMGAVLDKVRGMYDFVLIDAPPLLPIADSAGLSTLVDGVVLSVRYGVTTTEQLRQAVELLHAVRSKVLGVILNIVPPRAEGAAQYGYGYDYADPDGDGFQPRRGPRGFWKRAGGSR